MAKRKQLPDIMGEALGRVNIRALEPQEAPLPSPKVVAMPTEPGVPPPALVKRLKGMRLKGMALALEEQGRLREEAGLAFEERLDLLLDREEKEREDRRLKSRLKKANLRYPQASLAGVDLRHPRGLDPVLLAGLADLTWLRARQNLIITGPTGTGKTYLACALLHQVCLAGRQALYHRLTDLLGEMAAARKRGGWGKLMKTLAKVELLALDDWGLDRLDRDQRRDLLELVESRYGRSSTLVASPIPAGRWQEALGGPGLAGPIVDRLVHNAHQMVLQGQTLRRRYPAGG
jgi:DNA replication protein DnaC